MRLLVWSVHAFDAIATNKLLRGAKGRLVQLRSTFYQLKDIAKFAV